MVTILHALGYVAAVAAFLFVTLSLGTCQLLCSRRRPVDWILSNRSKWTFVALRGHRRTLAGSKNRGSAHDLCWYITL